MCQGSDTMDELGKQNPSNPHEEGGQKQSRSTVHITAKELLDELDKRGVDVGNLIIQKIISKDDMLGSDSHKWTKAFTVMTGAFTVVMLIGTIWVSVTLSTMNRSYNQQMERIIMSKTAIESANSWEQLPPAQKKEKLREQYYAIVRYYTNDKSYSEKMADDMIIQSFNQLWAETERLTTVNFFMPVAFMKATTNFNPYYNSNNRVGMAYFYLKNAENVANLPLIRNDTLFQLDYKGSGSLTNPVDSMKLLVARIDDLSRTFNGREDWIFLALCTNEYDVISKYWQDGKGSIPDDLYLKGPLADCLKYYQGFKNWEIPKK